MIDLSSKSLGVVRRISTPSEGTGAWPTPDETPRPSLPTPSPAPFGAPAGRTSDSKTQSKGNTSPWGLSKPVPPSHTAGGSDPDGAVGQQQPISGGSMRRSGRLALLNTGKRAGLRFGLLRRSKGTDQQEQASAVEATQSPQAAHTAPQVVTLTQATITRSKAVDMHAENQKLCDSVQSQLQVVLNNPGGLNLAIETARMLQNQLTSRAAEVAKTNNLLESANKKSINLEGAQKSADAACQHAEQLQKELKLLQSLVAVLNQSGV
jgi:hypothetical protein